MKQIKLEKSGLYESKKSKFLGFAFIIEFEDDVQRILERLKAAHSKAEHVVYAYRLEEEGQIKEKFHNSKEPSGSAGPPLLSLLHKKDIINCLVVVVRYFGGTELGVGGLVRAYTKAGQTVLDGNLVEHGDQETENK